MFTLNGALIVRTQVILKRDLFYLELNMATTSQRLEKLQNIEKVREIRGITTPR